MGVRLDYFLASESLRPIIAKADVLHEVTDAPSTPIILELDVADVPSEKHKAAPTLDFFEMGLKVGDILTYTLNPAITVSIATNRKVLYQGKEVFLTPLTNELRGKNGHMGKYWDIDGKTIDDQYYATYYPKQPLSPEAQLVSDFINERLGGDIEKLATFPLASLKGDKKYGCPGRSFDCDDTNLSRAIYCLAFSDVFPAMNLDRLSDWTFRGDTLNTYNTMFGRPDETSMHPGLDRYNPSTELSEKVKAFHDAYHTIGNLMPLPNTFVGRQSINLYRGTHPNWRDFLDRFLSALRPILLGVREDVDAGLCTLVEANMDRLSPYCSEDGFAKFMKGLMLEDYLDSDGVPMIKSKGFYFWRKNNNREEYLAEAERYIDFATGVIAHRAQRIINIIRRKI